MITGDPLYSKSTIIELGLVTNYIYIYILDIKDGEVKRGGILRLGVQHGEKLLRN